MDKIKLGGGAIEARKPAFLVKIPCLCTYSTDGDNDERYTRTGDPQENNMSTPKEEWGIHSRPLCYNVPKEQEQLQGAIPNRGRIEPIFFKKRPRLMRQNAIVYYSDSD